MILRILEEAVAILWVILGLGIVIFVHELGHFLMAKKNRVPVEIFSLGFGPALFKFRRGGTEYRLSLIPLGGYVKMEGETLAQAAANATPWQRFEIYVAGATMNLLVAFPICMLMMWIGRYEAHPVVGVPAPTEAADGLRPGDRVVEVDGRIVSSLDQVSQRLITRAEGASVAVKVLRGGEEMALSLRQRGSERHMGRYRTEPVSAVLGGVRAKSAAEAAGLRAGDRIVAVEGTPVWTDEHVITLLERTGAERARIEIERGAERFTVDLPLAWRTAWEFPEAEEMIEPVIARVDPGFASHAEFPDRPAGTDWLEEGDRILSLNGAPVGSWAELREALRGQAGGIVTAEVDREGERKTLRIQTGFNRKGEGILGVTPRESGVIAQVREGSLYAESGLHPGMQIVAVGDRTGENVSLLWIAPKRKLRRSEEGPLPPLEVRVMDRSEPILLECRERRVLDASELLFDEAGWRFLHRRGFGEGIKDGLREPVDLFVMTLGVLKKLFWGEESVRGLAGPVGIARVSYRSAKMGFGNFLWILALITVNLGIVNLLPLPLLDGGHIVLLGYEVVTRKRPGPRFEAIYTYVGLALILGLVLLVTYNDIFG